MRLELSRHASATSDNTAAIALAPRDAALLAFLALEGPTPRSRLAALLWPDSDAEAARNALRQRLFTLRKSLGFEAVAGSAILALAEGVTHDLDHADSVLGDAAPVATGAFADWLEQQRSRRRGRIRDSLAELALMAENARDWGDALSHAQELLALEPLSEAAHRRVIRLHYLGGDRAAALLAFDRCEQVLKNEIGAAPSAETLALLATLEQSRSATASTWQAGRVPASMLRPPRLIGRELAWQSLQQAWNAGRIAIVTGEGGMGKSRLIGDFAAAQVGCRLVGARPGDDRVVYASLSRWLRALPTQALRGLDPALCSELAALLPELGVAPAKQGNQAQARFFNAVSAALNSPALEGLVVDDLHFADAASLEALGYAVAASPQRWIVTAREDELSPAGRTLLADWLAEPASVQVRLAPLTLEQVTEVVESLELEGVNGSVAALLLRHSGGNPLYLLETLKAWLGTNTPSARAGAAVTTLSKLPARLPMAASLHALIERRIGRLSFDAVRLARCAAVAAPDFSIELASHVLGLRTLDLSDPWAELEAAQVLRDGAFAHDLIYESALASVPVPVARQLHAEIAAFLLRHDGEPARLAAHWVQARQWVHAASAFSAAAQRSRDASRHTEQCALLSEAARCFGLAGQAADQFDALLQRARVLASNDLGADASAAVSALEQAATTDVQRLLALDAKLELAMTRYEIDAALQLGRQAIVSAQALGRADLELRFAIVLSGALCDARCASEAVTLLEPYAAWVGTHASIEEQWEYWEATALALDYANRLRDALPAWNAARAAASSTDRRDLLWKTMSNAASTQAKMGLVREAAHAAEQAHQLALASNEAVSIRVLQMQVTLAHRLRDVGRIGEAMDLLEHALAGYGSSGASDSDKALAEQRLVVVYQQLGQPARAQPLLAAERSGVPRGVAMIRLAHRAELAAHLGRDGVALMREALLIIPDADDIYHRITSLFATRLLPADEGEALAANLALWAALRERYGVALAGHVRAGACAMAQNAPKRALPHAEAALHLARQYLPDSFYLPEMWLVAAQTLLALGRMPDARRNAQAGVAWVMNALDTTVPADFRDSFLHRNPVNRELLALSQRLAAA